MEQDQMGCNQIGLHFELHKLIIVEIMKEELELLTLIHKLQQVHFIHVVSELDCVIGWLNELDCWI
jgi:hypothetical protein